MKISVNSVNEYNLHDLISSAVIKKQQTNIKTFHNEQGEGVIGDFSLPNRIRGSYYSMTLNQPFQVRKIHGHEEDIVFTVFAKTGGGIKEIKSPSRNIFIDGTKENLDGIFIISDGNYSFNVEVPAGEYQLCYNAFVKREYLESINQKINYNTNHKIQRWVDELLNEKDLFWVHSCSKETVIMLEDLKYNVTQNSDIEIFHYVLKNISLITGLIKDYKIQHQEDHHYLSREQFHTLKNIKSFLQKDFSKKYNLEELSQLFGLNTEQIKYLFKKGEGVSFSRWYLKQRLAEAKSLLNHHVSLNDVSYKIGYSAPTHFIRAFKKENGITPSQFKKQQIEI